MASISSLVSNAIENLRKQVKVLATLDNPTSSLNERAEAIQSVLVGDSNFWLEIAKRTTTTKLKKVGVVVVKQVARPENTLTQQSPAPKPGTVLLASMPTGSALQPKTAPARVPQGIQPRPKLATPTPVNGDFAAKLNGAAKKLGFEDKSPLVQFRKTFSEVGFGRDYWDLCRELTARVLSRGLLKEEADWHLLAGKMKSNLFFNGKDGETFIAQCPKDILSDLVIGLDGLSGLVEKIRTETVFNPPSTYRLSFVIDMCLKVGKEAEVVLENCKHVVNRMKQRKFISAEHSLVKKAATAKIRRPIPPEKYISLGNLKPVVETQTTQSSDQELAVELTGGKPTQLDPAFSAAFERQMMETAADTVQ